MMDKSRGVGRYVIAGSLTALYGCAIYQTYRDLGTEPKPNTVDKLKKVAITATVLAGLTWVTAVL